jgi:Tfp pilus assembly protein PilF
MYEVVELMPHSAKYEAMLADALASHPVLCKRAERHFRRALFLEPQNADLHYRLGRYYQSFKMKSRALSEYKSALRINPKHSKARSALVEDKDANAKPMEQLFKKFFG